MRGVIYPGCRLTRVRLALGYELLGFQPEWLCAPWRKKVSKVSKVVKVSKVASWEQQRVWETLRMVVVLCTLLSVLSHHPFITSAGFSLKHTFTL